MKLRYYMRGLGIGIIITALIMGIGSSRRSTANDNSDLQQTESGAYDSQAVVLADIKEEQPTEADSEEQTPVPETDSGSETADTPTDTPAQTPEKTEASTPSPAPGTDNESVQDAESKIITFTIENGTGSETVSRNLEAAGLIEDASSFNRFLCDNGYSKSIRAGSFEIPTDADENEIAEIITGK